MFEFDTCIGGCEVPVGRGVIGVAVALPGGDFVDEGLFVALRANDDETSTCREFTLEGRGHDIQWLCPF